MSYLQTVTEIRNAAAIVNPNGTFDHGGHVDISQNFDKALPFIYLYPFNSATPVDPEFIETHTVLLGFFEQDEPGSETMDREQIIGRMDVLSRSFLIQLGLSNKVRIVNAVREPVYKFYQGHFSGYFLRFTYQNFAPCT
jgi:hypothetical protein